MEMISVTLSCPRHVKSWCPVDRPRINQPNISDSHLRNVQNELELHWTVREQKHRISPRGADHVSPSGYLLVAWAFILRSHVETLYQPLYHMSTILDAPIHVFSTSDAIPIPEFGYLPTGYWSDTGALFALILLSLWLILYEARTDSLY